MIDQQCVFETKEYLLSWSTNVYLTSRFISNLWQLLWWSVRSAGCLEKLSWIEQTLSREDGYDIADGSGKWCLTIGTAGPAFPHGWRPLAVFIGVSVRSLAACIPLPLHTQWWLSAAFLCLCPLSETKQALANPNVQPRGWGQRTPWLLWTPLSVFTDYQPSIGLFHCVKVSDPFF